MVSNSPHPLPADLNNNRSDSAVSVPSQPLQILYSYVKGALAGFPKTY
jgi:hypothetical protein